MAQFTEMKVKGYVVLSITQLKRMLKEVEEEARRYYPHEKRIKQYHTKVFYSKLIDVKSPNKNMVQIQFN